MAADVIKKQEEVVNQEEPAGCNCRDKAACPFNGACLTREVVYEATVESGPTVETYTGLTEGTFKARYDRHNYTFRHEEYKGESKLSGYIWKLKSEDKHFSISWKLLDRAKAFNPSTNMCRLCLKEKFSIMFNPKNATLNQRKELYAHCRHKAKHYLNKLKS